MIRAALIALLPVAAAAQTPCLPLPTVIEGLADAAGEAPAVRGLTPQGNIVTLWSNPITGTWTLTVTAPDGRTCLIGAGIALETIAANLPPNL